MKAQITEVEAANLGKLQNEGEIEKPIEGFESNIDQKHELVNEVWITISRQRVSKTITNSCQDDAVGYHAYQEGLHMEFSNKEVGT